MNSRRIICRPIRKDMLNSFAIFGQTCDSDHFFQIWSTQRSCGIRDLAVIKIRAFVLFLHKNFDDLGSRCGICGCEKFWIKRLLSFVEELLYVSRGVLRFHFTWLWHVNSKGKSPKNCVIHIGWTVCCANNYDSLLGIQESIPERPENFPSLCL